MTGVKVLTISCNVSPEIKPVWRLDAGYDVIMQSQAPVEVSSAALTEASDVEVGQTLEVVALLPTRGATQGCVGVGALEREQVRCSVALDNGRYYNI